MKIITSYFKESHQVLLLVAFLLITGCYKDKESGQTPLSGRFVNDTFLTEVTDSIPGLIPVYCYELYFDGSDSVDILYGFEKARLAYKNTGSTFKIVNALKNKDIVFTVNKNTLTLIDSAWNGASQNSKFREAEKGEGFINELNKTMIAGTYTLYKAGKITQQTVNFQSDGTVTGLEKFSRYTLCYSGDCVGAIYPVSTSITLLNDQQESTLYALKRYNDQVGIYHIEAPVANIKGERAIKELAFDLRK